MHDIQTVRITFTHQPHQPDCNPKHMYQHLMYWLDSYDGHAESAVQLIWHTNLCIPSRTGIRTKRTAIQTIRIKKHPTLLAIQTIRGPDGRKVCIKGYKTYEFVTRLTSTSLPSESSSGEVRFWVGFFLPIWYIFLGIFSCVEKLDVHDDNDVPSDEFVSFRSFYTDPGNGS